MSENSQKTTKKTGVLGVGLNDLLSCPFCGGAPVAPIKGIGGLFTYCSTILPKKKSCPIGGVPMGVSEWQNRQVSEL